MLLLFLECGTNARLWVRDTLVGVVVFWGWTQGTKGIMEVVHKD